MTQDTTNLIAELKTVATGILKTDVTTVIGFRQRQLEAIAKQTELIKKGHIKGDIDAELLEFFLKGLDDMVHNFTNTLKGIILVTIEKLWNAIIKVLHTAIGLDK